MVNAMAELVFALATSHGPMLGTPPDQWILRANGDRTIPNHWFRGEQLDFERLSNVRADQRERFAAACSIDEWRLRHARCQNHLDVLAARFAAARIDLVVIVGNDQRELLTDDLRPSILVVGAPTLANVPLTEAERAKLPEGISISELSHCPQDGAQYPGAPSEAACVAQELTSRGFDVAFSKALPMGSGRHEGVPHAFGFIYRRILCDIPPPSIPIMLNVGVPPNRPTAARCMQLGHALLEVVRALPGNARIALVASGGLSHFVIDETVDAVIVNAISERNIDPLAELPESWLEGHSAEIKNWIPVIVAAATSELELDSLDYVPCYRTEAGTGNAMAFASWSLRELEPA
jgi:hypothetical protein